MSQDGLLFACSGFESDNQINNLCNRLEARFNSDFHWSTPFKDGGATIAIWGPFDKRDAVIAEANNFLEAYPLVQYIPATP
ncbi:MAG: hypothetical protein ACM3KR_11250 [Deltaproteobacteria bacterium]